MMKPYDGHYLDVGGDDDRRRRGEQDRVVIPKTCNGFPATGRYNGLIDFQNDERPAQAGSVGDEDQGPSGIPEDNDENVSSSRRRKNTVDYLQRTDDAVALERRHGRQMPLGGMDAGDVEVALAHRQRLREYDVRRRETDGVDDHHRRGNDCAEAGVGDRQR